MNIQELQELAMRVRGDYETIEKKNGKVWTRSDIMSGFVGDVGDLSKIIMAKEGLRGMEDIDKKLEHELCDCLWSVLVLASKYDIDLDDAFPNAMKQLESRIQEKLSNDSIKSE